MTNLQQALLASLESVAFYSINNDAVRTELHQAKAALQVSIKYNSDRMTTKFFAHLAEAKRLIRASLPIDYTSKKALKEESWFESAPSKQQIDEEDKILSKSSFNHAGMNDWGYKITAKDLGCVNSKSKSKWARSGKQARTLSNR